MSTTHVDSFFSMFMLTTIRSNEWKCVCMCEYVDLLLFPLEEKTNPWKNILFRF